MITEEFQFSGAFVNSLWAIAAVCLAAPLLFYVFNAFKKRMSHAALAGGVIGFIALGYGLNSVALGGVERGALSALYYTIIEVAGAYAIMRWLAAKRADRSVPIGYALGYSAIPMLIMKGYGALMKLSVANAFNELGLTAFLESVDSGDRDALLATLNEFAAETLQTHLMIVAEYLLSFALTIGTVRLVWYSIHGEKRAANWGFLAAAIVLRFGAEYFYQSEYSIVTQCAYYFVCAVTFGASLLAARLWDNPETYTQHLSRKRL
ncbi:MAG: YhfC family intramembrane metalloprotease [Oscillospiraceae bacterium]|jgi:hypothetical protein|nr:YhfC family intramembrane metalloprotease [Oscillospiraceae bacterium]